MTTEIAGFIYQLDTPEQIAEAVEALHVASQDGWTAKRHGRGDYVLVDFAEEN